MLTALRKYTCTLGMETPPLKASFSIFEINKFGAGTHSFLGMYLSQNACEKIMWILAISILAQS